MEAKAAIMFLQRNMSSEELSRGFITSGASGIAAFALIFILPVFGFSVHAASAISNVLMSFVGFLLDVTFAKDFKDKDVTLLDKLAWFARSLIGYPFLRVVVLTAIDGLVVWILMHYLLPVLDKRKIKFAGRDAFIAAGLTALNFVLFVNPMRFQWAYVPAEQPTPAVNITVAFIMFALLIYAFDRKLII